MSNTYTQLKVHLVFAVKYRDALIKPGWEDALFKYSNGILSNLDCKLLAINGMPDHIHILAGFKPTISISDIAKVIKCNTSRWINQSNLCPKKFQWQSGYGAFTVSASQVRNVREYIKGQKAHHMKTSFKNEYLELLKRNEVCLDKRFLFSDPG